MRGQQLQMFRFFARENRNAGALAAGVPAADVPAADVPAADVPAAGEWEVQVDKNWLLSGS